MKYKAVIFDFDYTLGDSTTGIVLSANYALEQLGSSPKEEEQIKRTVGMTLKNTYAQLTQEDNQEKAELFQQYFREKANEVMTAHTKLFPDTKKVLKKLKEEHCKVGIVTTKLRCRIEEIIEKFAVTNYVEKIVGCEDVLIEKPNPEGLLHAITCLGVTKEEVLYVGDSIIDAQTAMNAGVDFAGVTTGTTSREEFLNYPHVKIVEHLEELLPISS